MFPKLSFPVDLEKGLRSGRFVSIGEWWGSGDRLWSLMEFLYTMSAIYLFVLVRSWAEVVAFISPMMRGVQFLFVLAFQSGRLVLLVCYRKANKCQ